MCYFSSSKIKLLFTMSICVINLIIAPLSYVATKELSPINGYIYMINKGWALEINDDSSLGWSTIYISLRWLHSCESLKYLIIETVYPSDTRFNSPCQMIQTTLSEKRILPYFSHKNHLHKIHHKLLYERSR